MLTDDAVRRVFIVPFWKLFHDCFECSADRMPILEWKLVGEWRAFKANREEIFMEQMAKSLELEPAAPTH